MSWSLRRSCLRLSVVEPRSVAARSTLLAVCALFAYVAVDYSPLANAEPSYAGDAARDSYGAEQRAEELYLDGIEKLGAGHAGFARETFRSVIDRYPATAA